MEDLDEDIDPNVLIALIAFGTTGDSLETMGVSASVYRAVAHQKDQGLAPTVWTVTHELAAGKKSKMFVLTVGNPATTPKFVCWMDAALSTEESYDSVNLKQELEWRLRTTRERAIDREETKKYTERVSNLGPLGLTLLLGMLYAGTVKFSGFDEATVQALVIWGTVTVGILMFLILWPLNKPLVSMFVTQKHLHQVWKKDKKVAVIDALAEKPAA